MRFARDFRQNTEGSIFCLPNFIPIPKNRVAIFQINIFFTKRKQYKISERVELLFYKRVQIFTRKFLINARQNNFSFRQAD